MEDSTINPYVPNESEKIRQKVYERQSPLGRIAKWSMIATAVVGVLLGIGLYFVMQQTEAADKDARTKLADVLQPPDKIQKQYKVESDIGFSLHYDDKSFTSSALVDAPATGTVTNTATLLRQAYADNELRIKRPYNYVSIRPRLSADSEAALAPDLPKLEIFANSSKQELEKAMAIPENSKLSKLDVFVKNDTDRRKSIKIADDNTVVSIESTKPVKSTVNGVDFKKVRFTTLNENYRVKNVKYDECYYTVQFEQPFALCITNVRPMNANMAGLIEQVLKSVTFQEVQTASATTQPSTSPAPAVDQSPSELPLATITPSYYTDPNSLKSIAKNQPGVVRIGTLYCADLALKFQSGETATNITQACVQNAASGVFVSRDGYIATSGHALRFSKQALINAYINFGQDTKEKIDRLQRILEYMLKAKLILQSDADYMKRGAGIGDQEALAKIQNIGSFIDDKLVTVTKDEYSFAVQLREKPISLDFTNKDKPVFAYSDTVLKATEKAVNYTSTPVLTDEYNNAFPSSDIGLLKVDGSFPNVQIASVESDVVKSNDTLNVIGYTSYADGSLTFDSNVRDFPVATTGKVEQVFPKDGTNVIKLDTAMLAGNDGAPVFDNNGWLVGFASYGLSYCPDEQCLGNGTIRSVSELKKLLDDKNISIRTDSSASQWWRSGVNEFFRANYASAADLFAQSGTSYSINRWAAPLNKLATQLKGSTKDTSFMNQLQIIMIIVIAILAVMTILLFVVYWLQRRRSNNLRVGLYGSVESSQTNPAAPINGSSNAAPIGPDQVTNASVGNQDNQPVNPPANAPSDQSQNPRDNQVPPTQQPADQPEDPFYK